MSCITEILKLKGNNDYFVPEGSWTSVEGGGTYNDHEYLIVLNTNGHRCGYVALKPEHPYSKLTANLENTFKTYDYDSLDIDVHGGLTFMSPSHDLKNLLPTPCNDMWIGFDCGHYGDFCDTEAFKKYFGAERFDRKESFFKFMNDGFQNKSIKDFNYVEKECHSVIDQLISIGGKNSI